MLLKQFLSLTKPGIIFGNIVTTLGGLFLAAQFHFDISIFIITLIATSLVVASGCVWNNIIDQDIDQNMQRTQKRALVTGDISTPAAIIFAITLGCIGFCLLWFATNVIAFGFAVLGFVVYVIIYSLFLKRHSTQQTLIGSISGACPPVIGYSALSNQFDVAALLLFLSYAFWQMPHSWAIALFRFDDYKNANIPILPIVKGTRYTLFTSLIYIILFTICCNLFYIFGYSNAVFALLANALCIYWLYLNIIGFKISEQVTWAKKYFLYSVLLITIISISFAFTAQSPSTHIVFF